MKKGFTLIEIMTVLGAVIIFAVIAFPHLSGLVRKRALTASAQSLTAFVRDAQQRSILQEDNRYWGVRVENVADGDRFSLFSALDTVPSGVIIVSTSFVRSGIEFLEPTAASTDIIFNKISGKLVNGNCPSPTFNLLVKLARIGDSNSSEIIKIYCNGHIE